MRYLVFFLLLPLLAMAQGRDTIEARLWTGATSLDARADKPMWKRARAVSFQHDWRGEQRVGHLTTVRASWTDTELWLLIGCGYDALTISSGAETHKETDRLWAISDVAEVFIAPNPQDVLRYKEFQVSPAGQWVDLHIDRETKKHDVKWNSGFRTMARIDSTSGNWWAEMAIPLKAFERMPADGERWRLNFYRIEHGPPLRHIAWQPTHTPKPDYHVPQAFGWIWFRK
ncbi:MAG: carbohydrate-binding family 9-like protein [Burkholderiales bacterium]